MRAAVDRARRVASRRMLLVSAIAAALVLLAEPAAGAASDLFQNIGPASQLPQGALSDRYPLGHYELDHHFAAVKAGVLSGIDVSGIPPTIAWFLANTLWQLTAFLAHLTITVFTFAFSLDLVNGSPATGGAGALAPVSRAVGAVYQTTFGEPWMVVAILLASLWAIYQALVRRRYTETAGSLALSVVLVIVALAFVTQPQRTIGTASRWSNAMSGAFLSLTSKGTVSNQQQAKQNASDQLFALLVYQPWTVLQFGGLEHCVKAPVDQDDPQSVGVRPLATDPARDAQLSAQLRRSGQVQGDRKACVSNERKYAPHFLGFAGDQRDDQYEALKAGDTDKLPDADPGKRNGSYRLSAVDKPAADAMGKDGQYERLLLSLVLFVGELGAFLLLGALSIGVILAQVLVLLLVAFAPVALVIAVFPGRGHEFFLGWLTRLAAFLLRKAVYSLILAVLLAVTAAVGDASSNLGWLMAFGLQATFFWAVFLYRHQLAGHLTLATTGHSGRDDGTAKLVGLYAAARALKRLGPTCQPPPPPPPPSGQRSQPTAGPPGPGPGSPDLASGDGAPETGDASGAGDSGAPANTTGPAASTPPDPAGAGGPARPDADSGRVREANDEPRRVDTRPDRRHAQRPGGTVLDDRSATAPARRRAQRPAAARLAPASPPIDPTTVPDRAADRPAATAAGNPGPTMPTADHGGGRSRGDAHGSAADTSAGASTPLLRDLDADAQRLKPTAATDRAERSPSPATDRGSATSAAPSAAPAPAPVPRVKRRAVSTRDEVPADRYDDGPPELPASEERS
ncbi:hypothetical protein AB0L40_05270 [Patulibacter sp. NPDC049589]|uniref:hypothetical protein n=1 Tax=Patulibacter sp. NPDC049589 TaxID=3154731 RepID=UPI00341BD3EC